jgi:hypothetical protein
MPISSALHVGANSLRSHPFSTFGRPGWFGKMNSRFGFKWGSNRPSPKKMSF